MKKKITAALLALMLITAIAIPAFAEGEDLTEGITSALPEPGTVFGSYEGVVTEVTPFYNNEVIEEGKYYVLIETENGPVRFFINEESQNVTWSIPEVGDVFTGYYDMSLPVIMIYPPQFNATSFAVNLGDIEYMVNGEKIEAPAPFIEGYTVMVPARAIAEALGYKVVWNSEDNSANIGTGVKFIFGKDYYTIGRAAPIELGIVPVAVNNRAYVPLSFFRQVINMNNAYFSEGQIVINDDEAME